MRFYLLPISTRQSLLYCHQLAKQSGGSRQSWQDWATNKAGQKWIEWEEQKSGWQKKVTGYGNAILQRLPHEEWSLKGIPALSAEAADELSSAEQGKVAQSMPARRLHCSTKPLIEIVYPGKFIDRTEATRIVQRLASDQKQAFHQKWFWSSVAGLPVTIPVGLIPLIPNFPFIYLAFRAWSHWRARSGSKHLRYLLDSNEATFQSLQSLDTAYTIASQATRNPVREKEQYAEKSRPTVDESLSADDRHGSTGAELDEAMIISADGGKMIAERLAIPGATVELERAVWQVEREIEKRRAAATRERSRS